ncbi:MAG: phosphoglycerate kinase [Patescibacteria group bacterium]|nr:phosphoglycerate kinase [Patescibacteria group bacterium]
MKTLRDFNVKNKKVLVRCDFNVPLDEKGNILDDFRIKQTIPTIKYLAKRGAKIILMSHLGEPEGKVVESLRLTPIQEKLKEYLDYSITKTNDCIGKETKKRVLEMTSREILLLENLRFHQEEKKNDENFVKKLAKLGDIYINDAFGVCHRSHASIVGIPKYLPSGAGLLLEKEIRILSKVLKKPWRPLVAIIGGVKISSKIKVIEKFLKKADHLLLGGEIANAILAVKGILLSQPIPEPEVIKTIEKIDLTCPKLHLPVDIFISLAVLETGLKEGYLRQGGPGQIKKEEKGYDIGPETVKIFSRIIKTAKMIFWSGPLGMFEEEKFAKGTKEIAQIIARNHLAFKIAGGGDTVLALNKFDLFDKFDHISTGGGAMLEFLSGKKLPGLEALR